MWLMGASFTFFVVLCPSGVQILLEPFDALYTTESLVPSLVRFWEDAVLPAFAERDARGADNVYVGWVPTSAAAAAAVPHQQPPRRLLDGARAEEPPAKRVGVDRGRGPDVGGGAAPPLSPA
jgi:hypothetical protein